MTDNKDEGIKSSIHIAGWLSLLIGLASVAASLYIFYASKDRPMLAVEQHESVTYVTTKPFVGVGKVELTVNEKPIRHLGALPFSIKNEGNVPLSSIQNSGFYNLVSALSLEVSAPIREASGIGILSVQLADASASPLTIKMQDRGEMTALKIDIRHLNPGETANFSLLYSGEREPTARVVGNPIIGGAISFIRGFRTVSTDTIWGKLKSVWLAQGLGILFLAQAPIFAIYFLVGARNLVLEKQSRDYSRFEDPEEKQAEDGQRDRIDRELQSELSEIDGSLLKSIKEFRLRIPLGMFEEKTASRSIYEIFWDAYREAWEYSLKQKFPLPSEIENRWSRNLERRVITPWFGWGDFFGTVALFCIPSLLLSIFGYALLFL